MNILTWHIFCTAGKWESEAPLRFFLFLTACGGGAIVMGVRVEEVSFEQLQRDKRRARLRDERRLALGLVTPEQLQEENSLIPSNARITIPALCETLERYYGK